MLNKFLVLSILAIVSLSCDRLQSEASYLSKLKERGFIIFITRNSLSTYYSDKDGEWVGFEYDLAKAFAKEHNLNLRVMVAKNANQAFQFLQQGLGDFIGAGLVATSERQNQYRLSTGFYETQQRVVCNRFGKKAKSRNDLSTIRFVVGKNTSYANYLRDLAKVLKGLKWREEEISTEELLVKVNDKEIDCTVADSHTLSLQQRIVPNLTSTFALSPKQDLHWFVKKENHQLQKIVNKWLEGKRQIGYLQEVTDRYFGFMEQKFDYYDSKVFEDRIKTRLKEWKPLFKLAEKQTGIDWKLLAALSYQESHWEPSAVSPTGVKGLMMLTNATAVRMGVVDRTDPRESILAGAKYFLWLKKRFQKEVSEPDLTFIALAAYNVGHGHLDDIMGLANQKNLPHAKWAHIKDLLPLLSRPEVYSELKYGYANGSEPQVYVFRVRNFYRILTLKKNI